MELKNQDRGKDNLLHGFCCNGPVNLQLMPVTNTCINQMIKLVKANCTVSISLNATGFSFYFGLLRTQPKKLKIMELPPNFL